MPCSFSFFTFTSNVNIRWHSSLFYFFCIRSICLSIGRSHTQNLAPPPPPQLSTHDAVHARSDRVAGLVDEHARVVVEADHAAVGPLHLFPRAHDDGVPDVPALDFVGGGGDAHAGVAGAPLFLDDGYDSVTCGRGSQRLDSCLICTAEGRRGYDQNWPLAPAYSSYGKELLKHTDCSMSPLANDQCAFHYGSSRVVDAVQHRL